MKLLTVKPYNGGFAVWWNCDGFKVFESYHATEQSAERHVKQLCKEYGYVRDSE